MDFEFREAQPPNTQGISEIRSSEQSLLIKLGITPPPKVKVWQCVCDSKVVGHCGANAATGEVVSLGVSADFEGLGIGRQLLAFVVDWLRAAGATRIWLDSPSDPSQRAYGFYRALGWQPSGQRPIPGHEILELPGTEGDIVRGHGCDDDLHLEG
jgi:ribosomal protein S18 acetylase RimI-like enzyme